MLLVGCGKQAPPSQPPQASEPESASTEQQLRPGEVANTYEGHDDEDGDDDGDEALDDEASDDEAGTSTPEDDGRLDAVELRALANTALDQALDPYAARVVTPLLPTEWPSTSGRVMVLAYPLTPLESGVTRYSLFAATHRVTIDVNDGTVTTEPIGGKKAKKLGTLEQTRERSDDPIHAAEQALVDVVAGRTTPEKARRMLYPYVEWAKAHGAAGHDVEGREAAFFELVRGERGG